MDADDANHESCLELLERHPGPLAVPVLAVTEVSYVIAARLGAAAEARFLGDLASGGFVTVGVDESDWIRMAELVWRYRDLPLGAVDASVVTTAERLGVTTLLTLDRRRFAVVRPRHVEAFELLP